MLWILVAASVDLEAQHRVAHVVLSLLYTGVCAFRAFWPRIDLERWVLVDHWLSSIALGRTAATLAELAFTVQLSLVLFVLSDRVWWLALVGWAILPLIALAQLCCWAGVLTGNHLWHAAEEALWALMVFSIAVCGVALWPDASRVLRGWILFGWTGCAASGWVMLGLDVPMYLARYRMERAEGRVYKSAYDGFLDAVGTRIVHDPWSHWRQEALWITPYFTGSVWLSLLIARFEPVF